MRVQINQLNDGGRGAWIETLSLGPAYSGCCIASRESTFLPLSLSLSLAWSRKCSRYIDDAVGQLRTWLARSATTFEHVLLLDSESLLART